MRINKPLAFLLALLGVAGALYYYKASLILALRLVTQLYLNMGQGPKNVELRVCPQANFSLLPPEKT
jgi:hypothetical protein